jgi:hypothetical protein
MRSPPASRRCISIAQPRSPPALFPAAARLLHRLTLYGGTRPSASAGRMIGPAFWKGHSKFDLYLNDFSGPQASEDRHQARERERPSGDGNRHHRPVQNRNVHNVPRCNAPNLCQTHVARRPGFSQDAMPVASFIRLICRPETRAYRAGVANPATSLTSSAWRLVPVLSKSLRRWVFAVASVMPSASATSATPPASNTARSARSSVGVRP